MNKSSWYKLILLLTLSALIMSACGGGAAMEEPAAPADEPEVLETSDSEIAEEFTSSTRACGGWSFALSGYTGDADADCLPNDVIQFTVGDMVIQGWVRAPLSIYAGQQWQVSSIQFDAVMLHGEEPSERLFGFSCEGLDGFLAEKTNTKVEGTCTDKEGNVDWTITLKASIKVLSITDNPPPAPLATMMPWDAMQEGKDYLICADPWSRYIQYLAEGNSDKSTGDECMAGKLINKLAYRFLFYDLGYDYEDIVAVVYPDNVAGGYAFVKSGNLQIGRNYYVCSLDQDINYLQENGQERTLYKCAEAIYMGKATDHFLFNDDGETRLYPPELTGAFPSPMP